MTMEELVQFAEAPNTAITSQAMKSSGSFPSNP